MPDDHQKFICEATNEKIDSTCELDANRERDDWFSINEMLGETLSIRNLAQREQRLVDLSSSGKMFGQQGVGDRRREKDWYRI